MVQIKIGCDPELFLRDIRTGQLVSAHTILPGSKLEPYKVPGGAVQVDGTAAEFNTDPAETYSTFVSNIGQVMSSLKQMVGPNYELVINPTATFEPSYFNNLPEVVRELGCNPDFNAWTGSVNPAPDGDATTLRTASGHVHVGWCKDVNPADPVHQADCNTVVKQLDYYLGLWSLLWDPDPARRSLYGKAGACRYKPYGVEYRTMSNVWLRHTEIQKWVFNSAIAGVNSLISGDQSMEDRFSDFAQKVIDSSDVEWLRTKTGQTILEDSGLRIPNFKLCLEKEKEVGPKKISNYSYNGPFISGQLSYLKDV